MFISNLGCHAERGRNHSLSPKCRSKPLKSMNCITSSSSKPMPVVFLFPLLLVDLDNKYGNESELINNNSVSYLEYVNF